MTDLVPVRRALISVSDKTGLEGLAKALARHHVEILSTGGTAKALRDAGCDVVEVADHTGFPEILDGRVKTLQPSIHGGILGRRGDPDHVAQMEEHGIAPIDLVIVNLYPFEATVARGAGLEETIENIDIGGPALIRAAAKNHGDVAVIVDPSDYDKLIEALDDENGKTGRAFRRYLAGKAYRRTAAYDAAIGGWFAKHAEEAFPERVVIAAERADVLRYGENPHQRAAVYRVNDGAVGVGTAEQLQGKELSYNNLNDTDAAYELVSEFGEPTVAIIKHANPCGVATGHTLEEAYRRAKACDPVSAFGGIIAANRPIDAATAEAIVEIFSEVVIAPSIEAPAREIFAKKGNLRVLTTGDLPDPTARRLLAKSIAGGLLLQDRDYTKAVATDIKVVTERAPTEKEIADMLFATTVAKHVKSNTIVYVKDRATVGVGAGQMSRVDSARIAALKAAEMGKAAGETGRRTEGSVAASDAFFPFADGLEALVEAGATAVIQPGGSMRDDEVIEAANKAGLAMVFTGLRHFRH
ncbi:MAG: bifunctional phosphoribosylaminoimidazolecarboxamide formyltransferase/IMP cyclohydrolase [Alphaproteobacteria bacterium]|nr:bifunctional phosphoribosylaminoimidazolecarboxamide formyltransferase/IMP cyclohydrolase [Alphaproteobacteria bacterium]